MHLGVIDANKLLVTRIGIMWQRISVVVGCQTRVCAWVWEAEGNPAAGRSSCLHKSNRILVRTASEKLTKIQMMKRFMEGSFPSNKIEQNLCENPSEKLKSSLLEKIGRGYLWRTKERASVAFDRTTFLRLRISKSKTIEVNTNTDYRN